LAVMISRTGRHRYSSFGSFESLYLPTLSTGCFRGRAPAARATEPRMTTASTGLWLHHFENSVGTFKAARRRIWQVLPSCESLCGVCDDEVRSRASSLGSFQPTPSNQGERPSAPFGGSKQRCCPVSADPIKFLVHALPASHQLHRQTSAKSDSKSLQFCITDRIIKSRQKHQAASRSDTICGNAMASSPFGGGGSCSGFSRPRSSPATSFQRLAPYRALLDQVVARADEIVPGSTRPS